VLHPTAIWLGRISTKKEKEMTIKVGINGFGRIGRQALKAMLERYPKDIEVVAVNDLFDAQVNAHLFKHDSNYGAFNGTVEVAGGNLRINGRDVQVLAQRDPALLPWKDLGVEVVLESTGIFTAKEKAEVHITSGGAKKVIISAPAKGEDITIVLGVNEEKYDPAKHHVISNASCTTNCLAPAAKVLHDQFTILRGMMTTVHSYTNDQRILDLAHKDLRRARAAALNIIPTTTGAARALALVIPDLKGKFDGFALRVPTATVSIVDFVAEVKNKASVEAVNEAFGKAAEGKLKGILGLSMEPLVSTDYRGDTRSSIVDGLSTMVIGDTLVKAVSWYDNEWGYACRCADLVKYIGKTL
jgi:glyceraldehyde 3-phosphate dehydrogenase